MRFTKGIVSNASGKGQLTAGGSHSLKWHKPDKSSKRETHNVAGFSIRSSACRGQNVPTLSHTQALVQSAAKD